MTNRRTGIKAWPRVPEQRTTSYRAGSFLCPECGRTMNCTFPGFDLDEVPESPVEIFLGCKDLECKGKVLITARIEEMVDKSN